MIKKIYFFVCAFTLLSFQTAQASIYKGYNQLGDTRTPVVEYPTKGTSTQGLRNTLLSLLLAGPKGESYPVSFKAPHPQAHLFDNFTWESEIGDWERTCPLNLKRKTAFENGKGKAHLVFVIPGFGSNKDKGAASFLSELISQSSDEMVTLATHSPAYPDFIQYSSALGFPGSQRFEGFDLYQCLQAAKEKLQEDFGYDFDKISVVGASLGSMNAFRLAVIDLENQRDGKDSFGFHRVFSLNPPISNVYGSTAIDTFVGMAVGELQFSFAEKLQAFHGALTDLAPALLKKDGTFNSVARLSEETLRTMGAKDNLDNRSLKFLVGFGFAPTVKEAIEAGVTRFPGNLVDRVINDGVMTVKLFTGFLRYVTYQNWKKYVGLPNTQNSINQRYIFQDGPNKGQRMGHFVMTERESIGFVLPKMQKKYDLSHYHLVTWDDDFLLRTPKTAEGLDYYGQDDVEWIESTLTGGSKGHSRVFKKGGGHLGGFYQKPFQDYLRKNLR